MNVACEDQQFDERIGSSEPNPARETIARAVSQTVRIIVSGEVSSSLISPTVLSGLMISEVNISPIQLVL